MAQRTARGGTGSITGFCSKEICHLGAPQQYLGQGGLRMPVPLHIPKALRKSSWGEITVHQKGGLLRFMQTGIGEGAARALLVQDAAVLL